MEPSTVELVERIATALRERIAPLVADQPWPASELRSIDALLALVVARIEHEAEVVAADNAELELLLARLAEAGIDTGGQPLAGAGTATPQERNLAMRSALERAIREIHDGAHDTEVAAVRAYLVAAAEREQLIYGALTGRRLF
jgi:gamma-glutamyl:cysteine ligase YbdK (ATP-grasp superfamily)